MKFTKQFYIYFKLLEIDSFFNVAFSTHYFHRKLCTFKGSRIFFFFVFVVVVVAINVRFKDVKEINSFLRTQSHA